MGLNEIRDDAHGLIVTEIYLGTSGWSYKEWEGVFYPKKEKNKLSFYAKYFRTAEINSTFYAYPNKGMILGCARYTPDSFVFSAKIPQLITHDKRLDVDQGVKEDLFKFLDAMKPLMDRGKLGPLLVQLPPSFSYENGTKNLKGFLEILPSDVMFAVEFRHKSWLRDETYELLRGRNVANTIVDEPLIPPVTTVTADFAFVRWHGHGKRPWYNYRYTDSELTPWVGKVKEISRGTRKIYGYFNNHFHGFAIENSLKMFAMLGGASSDQRELLRSVTEKIEAEQSSSKSHEQKTLS